VDSFFDTHFNIYNIN